MEHTYIIMTSAKFGSDRNESVYVCWLTIYLLYKQYMLFNCDNFRVSINTLRLKVIQTNPQGASFCVAFNYGWIIDPGVIFQKALLLSAFGAPFLRSMANQWMIIVKLFLHANIIFLRYTLFCVWICFIFISLKFSLVLSINLPLNTE